MTRRLIAGLTGGIGAGKSTAATCFERRGAVIIDVDAVGRQVAEVGGKGHERVLERFGSHLVVDGALDRAALAAIVFGDPDALADLTAISHPAINETLAEMVNETPQDAIVVLDMAILVESTLGRWREGEGGGYEVVIVVETPLDQRIDRVVNTRGMEPDDVRSRIASQASDEERRAVADLVISNGDDERALDVEVERVWQTLVEQQAGS